MNNNTITITNTRRDMESQVKMDREWCEDLLRVAQGNVQLLSKVADALARIADILRANTWISQQLNAAMNVEVSGALPAGTKQESTVVNNAEAEAPANLVRSLRQKLGLSQSALAAAAGITRSSLRRAEASTSQTPPEKLERILEAVRRIDAERG